MVRVCCLALFVFAGLGLALDPHKAIKQFVHTSWTDQDGAPSEIRALAQTTDGYLWLGAATGLFRFDGVRFTRFEPLTGEEFPHSTIRALRETRDGGLWIVFTTGAVSIVRGGHVTSYSARDGLTHVAALTESPDGAIIAGTATGLMRFKDRIWKDIGDAWHFPAKEARRVFYDRKGALWVASENRINYLPAGRDHFIAGQPNGSAGLSPFAESPEGTVWFAEVGHSAHSLRIPGTTEGASETEIRVGATAVLFDRDGALWVGSAGDGLRRVSALERISGQSVAHFDPLAEEFTKGDGLSSGYVHAGLEDREGNIWWGTVRGLDRFREAAFTPVVVPYSDQPRSILSTRDGNLLMAAINRTDILRVEPAGRQRLLPLLGRGYSMFEDNAGGVWMGLGGLGPARLIGDRLIPFALPDGVVLSTVGGMTRDRSGWWFSDVEKGIFHFVNGKLDRVRQSIADAGSCLYTDRLDRVWIAHPEGISVFQNDHLQDLAPKDLPPGRVFAFQESRAGDLWAAGENGLSKFENGRFVRVSGGLPPGSVYGMVQDTQGAWWLAADTGVLRIEEGELNRALLDAAYLVRYETFNLLDGMPGLPSKSFPRPVIARTTDGRIWFANSSGMSFVDPDRIHRNGILPPVVIEAVRVNGKQMPPADNIALKHATNDLEIDYTALSLSIPERVFFRYKLEGAESNWHEAGTRRQAFYNHLEPGRYRFSVAACNNDGIWNQAGTSWNFRILPAFYQTSWFALLCTLSGVLLLMGLYRLRLRQIDAENSALFDVRLDERTRLAREFHDTLLQTIQGSKLVADDAIENCPDHKLRETVGRLSLWLERAAEEGRGALNALRSFAVEADNLVDCLRRAGEECVLHRPIRFDLSVEGTGRQLHPIIHDEVFRIGYEAIRNASLHSRASRLDVKVSFIDVLTLRVRDNGQGIEPEVAANGADGHFGLLGMYERALAHRGLLKSEEFARHWHSGGTYSSCGDRI